MKQFFRALAPLILAAVLCTTAQLHAKIFMNKISNNEYGFTVSSPRPGWNLENWNTNSIDGALIKFCYETDKEAIIKSTGVNNGSVEEEYTKAITEYVPLTDVHHETLETPWGIVDCYYWASIKNEELLLNVRLYTIHRNEKTYATTCACPEESLAQYENTFNTYVESLIIH